MSPVIVGGVLGAFEAAVGGLEIAVDADVDGDAEAGDTGVVAFRQTPCEPEAQSTAINVQRTRKKGLCCIGKPHSEAAARHGVGRHKAPTASQLSRMCAPTCDAG